MVLRPVLFAAALVQALSGGGVAFAQGQSAAPASPDAAETKRLYFLRDTDIPDGTKLLLTPRVLDDDTRPDAPDFLVIRDAAALRAVADKVWVANDDAALLKLLVLGLLFMSFPGNGGPSQEFATLLFPDGTQTSVFAYHPDTADGGAPPHDLAGLDRLAEPAFEQTASANTVAAYVDLIARLSADPDVFFLFPPDPDPPDLDHPLLSELMFPTLLLAEADATETRIQAEIARTEAAFRERFGPPGPQYAPFEVYHSPCLWPPYVTDNSGTPVTVGDGLLNLEGFVPIPLHAQLASDQTLIDQIALAAPDFDPADRIDPGLDAAFNALIADTFGAAANPADYVLQIDCWTAELQAFWPVENLGHVSYYQIGQITP
jgi:hypothetical protein